jgi:hypothetical protein
MCGARPGRSSTRPTPPPSNGSPSSSGRSCKAVPDRSLPGSAAAPAPSATGTPNAPEPTSAPTTCAPRPNISATTRHWPPDGRSRRASSKEPADTWSKTVSISPVPAGDGQAPRPSSPCEFSSATTISMNTGNYHLQQERYRNHHSRYQQSASDYALAG